MFLLFLLTNLMTADCRNNYKIDKSAFCAHLDCDSSITSSVCGIRNDGEGYRLKIFDNECDLLKFGCGVEDHEAYGLVNIEYCDQSFNDENPNKVVNSTYKANIENENLNHCIDICNKTLPVCGIKKDGVGFKVAHFDNECSMVQHNCLNNASYAKTFDSLCKNINKNDKFDEEEENEDHEGEKQKNVFRNNQEDDYGNKQKNDTNHIKRNNDVENQMNIEEQKYYFPENSKSYKDREKQNNNDKSKAIPKNIVVINTPFNGNINETIDAFFAATHLTKIPISEIPLEDQVANETSRRMLIKSAGPIMVFKPWITIPKEVSTDKWHVPTLASCYHKCPEKCPDTYAPVCGVPGIVAREPSLMFQNHCYMDKAQCKMYWENKSPTAMSSAYVESAFLFCLGDEITSLYRFLPLVRTLQHMGRLKKHGKFRYRLRNLRFFNNLLSREPNIMG